ncbi:MAG: 30S ribosomal protein S20 [Deltaproteobacteria bacterium]|nr:30S ribosomal protein S20 [Deltaproteobacteria bacterium]
MAKHKQALKRHRQSVKREARNRAVKSALRTIVKKARTGLESGKPEATAVEIAKRSIDRAASRGVLHKRTASRRVSRLARALNRAKSAK